MFFGLQWAQNFDHCFYTYFQLTVSLQSLQEDVIDMKIVIATALMAIARNVIILDFENISQDYFWAIASVVFAMSIAYWLVDKYTGYEDEIHHIEECRK